MHQFVLVYSEIHLPFLSTGRTHEDAIINRLRLTYKIKNIREGIEHIVKC